MIKQIISDSILLFLLMDTIGGLPIFINLIKTLPVKRQRIILVREVLIAGIILIIFLWFGAFFLQAMKISTNALEISGGILLFLIAVRMIFPATNSEEQKVLNYEPLIVPMAIPLMAGPASLATVIISATDPKRQITMLIAIIIISFFNVILVLLGPMIAKLFGNTGMQALERLMGLVLITIAVQMTIGGIKLAFAF